MTQVPTTDQIRHAIDSGATGEKVAHPDPAAAPFGTDAEAGGNPPTIAERAIEAKAQIDQPPQSLPSSGNQGGQCANLRAKVHTHQKI